MPMSKGVYNILLYINRINRLRGISVAPGSFVFINTLGNPIVGDCLRGRLDDLLKRHDLQGVSLHRFRHTFATRLFEAKVEMRYIQELLGHSNISMTQRYVHPNEEDKKDKIEQYSKYGSFVKATILSAQSTASFVNPASCNVLVMIPVKITSLSNFIPWPT